MGMLFLSGFMRKAENILKEIIKRPVKVTKKVIKIRKKYIPPTDHPWRRSFKEYFQPKLSQMADEK